jgi:hypothetical protein
MYNWPADILHTIGMSSQGIILDRLALSLDIGLMVATDYSGLDTPLHVLDLLVQAARMRGMELAPNRVVQWRSSDINKTCQSLLAWLSQHRVDVELQEAVPCVFGDINERVQNTIAARLDEMEPDMAMEKSSAATGYDLMLQHLMDNLGEAFPDNATAPCIVHHDRCCVRPVDLGKNSDARGSPGEGRRIHINVAGTICKGWSCQGKMKAHGDKSMRPHNIWLAERRAVSEDVIFHECTPRYDAKLLTHNLPGHRVIRVWWGPERMGWPVVRDRSFAACINLSTMVRILLSSDHMLDAFGVLHVLALDVGYGRCSAFL